MAEFSFSSIKYAFDLLCDSNQCDSSCNSILREPSIVIKITVNQAVIPTTVNPAVIPNTVNPAVIPNTVKPAVE